VFTGLAVFLSTPSYRVPGTRYNAD